MAGAVPQIGSIVAFALPDPRENLAGPSHGIARKVDDALAPVVHRPRISEK
jgi:hypothetical protein